MLIPELGPEPRSPKGQASMPPMAPVLRETPLLFRCLSALVSWPAALDHEMDCGPLLPTHYPTHGWAALGADRLRASAHTHTLPTSSSGFPVQTRSRPPTCPRHAVSCGSTLMGRDGLIIVSGFLSNYGPPQNSVALRASPPTLHLNPCRSVSSFASNVPPVPRAGSSPPLLCL